MLAEDTATGDILGRCNGQTQYLSFTQAEKAMKNIKRFKPRNGMTDKVAPYRCRFCSRWHLGHRQTA